MDPDPGNLFCSVLLAGTISFPWGLLLLFLILLSISFIISSSEVAFLTLNDTEKDLLSSEDTPAAKRVLQLIRNRKEVEYLLATILITNNFANVFAILVAVELFSPLLEDAPTWVEYTVNTGVITTLLLLFGEIVPKKFARLNRTGLAKVLSGVMLRLRKVLHGPAFILSSGTHIINRRLTREQEENVSLEDLKHAIDLTVNDDQSKEEKEILRGIVTFGNTPAKSVMRARVDVVAIDWETSFEEVIDLVNQHNFSRFPVYEEHLDNIKGIVHIKALLPLLHLKGESPAWQDHIGEAYFVPESKKIDDLLEELKRKRLHMAIVVDEYGGTAGVITLEDIIEEIFGEIMDESDSIDNNYRQIDKNEYIFEGKIPINDVKKIIGLDDSVFEDVRGDSDSLAGLILEINGKFPQKDEIITYQHFDLKIEAVDTHRIIRVKFTIKEEDIIENEK